MLSSRQYVAARYSEPEVVLLTGHPDGGRLLVLMGVMVGGTDALLTPEAAPTAAEPRHRKDG